ncbi:GNAT family N-acetyltransferase [Deinococcus deserti]|uniref:GNAT family N-acetyltransferase n=1 Tax=Deinococcus deserti TaxID=310783 RepID=UPI000A055EF7
MQSEPLRPEHEFQHYATASGEAWAVDLLSGEIALVGQGLGLRVASAFLAFVSVRPPAWQRILIDPDACNERAMRSCDRLDASPLPSTTI